MVKNFSRAFVALFVLFLAGSSVTYSQAPKDNAFPDVKISNFGRMDDRFYRGAQPKQSDYWTLKNLGINTIIDLKDDPEPYAKTTVEALGMRYVHIPIVGKAYPTPEQVAAFMKTVDDPATGKFFAHCAGGRHRTGNMGAIYRFEKYGWNFDQVYKEMKDFDFYSSWGHGKQKDFVVDYAEIYEKKRGPKRQPPQHPLEELWKGSRPSE